MTLTGVAEHLDHLHVLRQDLRDELVQPAFPSRLREVLEQQLAHAASLVRVLDQEGDLGLVHVDPVVPAGGDDLAGQGDHEADAVDVVDVGELVDVTLRQRGVRREEPQVLRLRGHPLVEPDQRLGVVGGDRAQVGSAAVGQKDVGLPVRGVRRLHHGRDISPPHPKRERGAQRRAGCGPHHPA
jgi:hypothetical protein